MVGGKSCQLKFQPNKPATNGIALGKKPIQSPHTKKGKMMKRQLSKSTVGCVLSLIVLCGCAGTKPLPPAFYALGTSTAVSLAVRNSPQTTAYLRAVQPVVCSLAAGRPVTPGEITLAVEQFAPPGTPEAVAIANSVLMLYIVAYNEAGTNSMRAQYNAKAIFCDGFAAGLGMETLPKGRALPPLPIYKPNPQWPLLRARD